MAEGKQTGVVVDVGDTHTTVTPIFDARIQKQAVRCSSVGGRDVIERLIQMSKKVLQVQTEFERQIFYQFKHEYCYVLPEKGAKP